MMIKKVILLFAVSFISYNSFSQDWKYLITSNEGMDYYCNLNRLKKENGIIDILVKTSFSNDAKLKKYRLKNIKSRQKDKSRIKGFESYSYTLYHEKYDCNSKRSCILEYIDYNSKREVLEHEKSINEVWDNVIPDSIGDALLIKLCELNIEE